MSRTITVVGATGNQGGGVVEALLKGGSWKIRGITRNTGSDSAKALASQGVEVITANINDADSLAKAFKGVHAIFAVTNFSDASMPDREGEIEYEQGVKMADAAAATPTLEHYIWSTLPSAEVATGGKIRVPHADYKARVDKYIKEKLPGLAKKTTFFWMGFYATNLAYFPPFMPTYMATANKHIWMHPCSPQTMLPINGAPKTNAGFFVRAILAQPQLTLPARYVFVHTDLLSIADAMKVWSKVTGKEGMGVEVSLEDYERLWPAWGKELGAQLQFNEMVVDLGSTEEVVLGEVDLGIEGEVVRLEATLTGMAGSWD